MFGVFVLRTFRSVLKLLRGCTWHPKLKKISVLSVNLEMCEIVNLLILEFVFPNNMVYRKYFVNKTVCIALLEYTIVHNKL